jgi:hypothetical protein
MDQNKIIIVREDLRMRKRNPNVFLAQGRCLTEKESWI